MSTVPIRPYIISPCIDPLKPFIRVRVTGKDRAKFLHNFCTNDIKSLPSGRACEAFFTDMKARILAHGWVLAGDDCHELWMLPGDETLILKHLNKYVITEDVAFHSISETSATLAVLGAELSNYLSQISAVLGIELPLHDNCWSCPSESQQSGSWAVLRIRWAAETLLLISLPAEQLADVWQKFVDIGFESAETSTFDRLRILERFPIIGTDISHEHLAPEADRNPAAISYTKGCYLGQEPIARLDAMGHINRALRTLRVEATTADLTGTEVHHSQSGLIGRVSSCAIDADGSATVALAMIKVHGIDLTSGLTVTDSLNQATPARILL